MFFTRGNLPPSSLSSHHPVVQFLVAFERCKMSDERVNKEGIQHDNSHDSSSDSGPSAGVDERKLKWKLDLSILPLMASIFFLALIGQSNIGNAYKAGLAEDLSLSPKQFANVNSLFLVGNVIGQLPGTLLLRQLGPQRQVSF